MLKKNAATLILVAAFIFFNHNTIFQIKGKNAVTL